MNGPRRLAAAALLASACGSGTATGPSLPLAGTYLGTLGDVSPPELGDGSARLQLEVGGSGQLSGTWLFDFSRGAYRRGGTLRGTAAAGRLDLTLLPEREFDCAFGVRANTADGDRLVGTFVAVSCQLDLRGRIDLTRSGL